MMRFVALPITVLAVLTNLPGLMTAGILLAESFRIHALGVMYFEYPYLLVGGVCLTVSGTGIAAAGFGFAKKGRYALLSLTSLTLGLVGAVLIPNIEPQGKMGVASWNVFNRANGRIYAWGVDHNRYPASEQELRDSLGPEISKNSAIYLRRGHPIPYNVRFATRTEGPPDLPVPSAPGVFDYSVAGDGREYSLRMTTLELPVDERVGFFHLPRDKKARVLTGKQPRSEGEAGR